MPHPVISMSHMNIKSLTFSPLIVSTSKNETKIITSRQIVEQIQFKREISSRYTLLLWFYDQPSFSFPSEPLHILMRFVCIISIYLSTVLVQNKKMIQILITSTQKISEAICLNNWWHCSRIARLTLEPGCVPVQTRGDIVWWLWWPYYSIQTKWIVEHTGRDHGARGGNQPVCVGVVCSYRTLSQSTQSQSQICEAGQCHISCFSSAGAGAGLCRLMTLFQFWWDRTTYLSWNIARHR